MAEKHIRTERHKDDYEDMGETEHVLERPGMYIGSVEPEERDDVLLFFQETPMKLHECKVNLSRGVERLFLEILSNSGDNADASRRYGVSPGSIDVAMDKQWIRVRNGGSVIPIEKHKNYPDSYIPDIVFGKLRSSSNYSKDVIRMGCGLNGLGAKLTNIFSKVFIVKVGDPKNKLEYTGTWQENMSIGPTSSVVPYNGTEGYVEVSWLTDFERFGITEYPDEIQFLYARYLADFSLTCKIPVSFNGVHMNFSNIKDYAALYWGEEESENSVYHCEWSNYNAKNPNGILPEGMKMATLQKQVSLALKAEHIPNVELMIIDTPENGRCFSFVNGMMTLDGGVHTNEAFGNISSHVIDIVNSTMNANKKGKPKTKDDIVIPKITSEDVKRHVSIVLNCRLPDPKFQGQTKDKLTGPKPHISVPNDLLKNIEKWKLIDNLYATLEAKMFNIIKKTNGGRVKHVSLEAGEDANDAGTDKSKDCTLYLVEGKSASAYPKKRIEMMPGNQDLNGWFPLRGKFLNVRGMESIKVNLNKEVKAIKTMLGLCEKTDYSKLENAISLRYGFVLICTDADSDGSHIASLLINYFDQCFPSILQTGKIGMLRTPVVRIKNGKGDIMHRFYTAAEYERWEKENVIGGNMPKGLQPPIYYKGLGKSDDEEIKDDLTTAPVVTILYDENAASNLTIAFDKTKNMSDIRKEWISKWRDATGVEDIAFEGVGVYRQQKISDFINHELIDYTKDALFRAIPSMDDGLKRSHRQALYAALKQFGRKNEMMGVSRFANYAANLTNYHHGEQSMCETVIKMAQNYIGSNNIPFFQGKGQFGTRLELGKDAASPRYLSVHLPKYASLLYDDELIECVPKRVIEGDEVEPLFIPAVIPMHLVNGVDGIATGYSTNIPSHNYFELIDWLREKCSGVKTPNGGQTLTPWYRGFKGTIELVDRVPENTDDLNDITLKLDEKIDDYEDEDEKKAFSSKVEDDSKSEGSQTVNTKPKGKCALVRGLFKYGQNEDITNLEIFELPVGTSIIRYRRWLEQLLKDKMIKDFRRNGTTEEPRFTIKGYQAGNKTTITYKMFLLERYLSMSNFTLIDINGYPTKFENTNQILEVYYTRMIQLYDRVRQTRLVNIKNEVEDLTFRIRFIQAIVDKKLNVMDRKKVDILKDMAAMKPSIPEKYLNSVKIHELTKEDIEEMTQKRTKLYDLYATTEKLTSEKLWLDKLDALESYLRKHGF
jgi:DNA topoisomerase-2